MPALDVPLSNFTTCGELLKFLRRRARLSQRELSIAVGYSESHISRIEHNERPVDRTSLLALFVPALHIQSEPEVVERLLTLCAQSTAAPSEPAAPAAPADTPSIAVAQPANHSHLPIQLTSFIGRQEEMTELCDLLQNPKVRLVTLTGVGGCGKTRLALRAGEEVAQAYVHGVWLAELSSLTDPNLLSKTVAAAFNLTERIDQPVLTGLTDFLYPRQVLLILDNCEHLVEAVARLAAALLRACPRLQILATSRESLGVPGEANVRVQPLALPPALPGAKPARAEVEGYDAIQLFV
ncbi:MAG: serine/threonine protein kinase, partial [Chloroflexi bacterium]